MRTRLNPFPKLVLRLALLSLPFIAWTACSDSDSAERIRLTFKYHLAEGRVEFEGSRPYDCDFLTAPIGAKHCHYRRAYLFGWVKLSDPSVTGPLKYGMYQEAPPSGCSADPIDFGHQCYPATNLSQSEIPKWNEWTPYMVIVKWEKVQD